jgi:hypothetical protein
MRRTPIVIALLFANNFAVPALAAPACLQPGEAQAFNIIGLKSNLMVDALSCGMAKNYDLFMTKFQPQVLDAQHLMDNYFVRQGGLAGAAMEDSFVTQLANSESGAAAQKGSVFCGQAAKQFAQVGALGGTMDLVSMAVSLKLAAPPAGSGICPAAPPVVVASAAQPAVQAPRPRLVPHKVPHVMVAQKPRAPAPAVSPYMMAQTI